MLNVVVQSNAAAAKAYFAGPDFDYLADGQEQVGDWHGRGAEMLGLSGKVDKQRFEYLCDNINPATGEQLTKITRTGRRTGYDLTWSAPKSISVVHALTGDERITQAFRDSISETMGEMEAEMQTRVRKGGQMLDRETGNMIWAEFIHLTSRPIDGVPCPQLHSHCFVFNATHDGVEDQWKAGQFGKIKGDSYYWQAVQQARFSVKLQEIGYQVRRTKDAFEISGVPESVIKKFSLRRGIIERLADQLGITTGKGRERLARSSRERKNDAIAYPDLVGMWDKRLTPDEREALIDLPALEGKPAIDNATHARFAADHIFERASVVDERRLLALALRHGCGEVTPEGVRAEANRIGLLRRDDNGKTLVTTKAVLAEESRMIRFAVAGKGTMRPLVCQIGGQTVCEKQRSTLSGEQQAVIDHLMTSPDRVMLVRGAPGTGKTYLTKHAVAEISAAGKSVTMLAPTTAAVDVLTKDGFEANTLQRFLVDERLQAAAHNGFIWCDESGLIGAKSMGSLFELADRLNARVALMGDKRQLASVSRGAPVRVLENIAKLPVAEVTEIRRQKPDDYRAAVRLLSDGKTVEGFDKLDAMGCVKVMKDYAPVAEEYVAAVRRNKSALIVCPTHAEGDAVVREVRNQLKLEGRLGNEEKIFERLVPTQWTEAERGDAGQYNGDEVLQFFRNSGTYKAGERARAEDFGMGKSRPKSNGFTAFRPDIIRLVHGDTIRVTANGKTKDGAHRLTNGATYTVKAFTKEGDITLTNGWTISKDFGHFTHGYVNTAYAAQGRTTDRTIIVSSMQSAPAMNREAFLVGASRGRFSCTIYTDDKAELRDAVQRTNVRMSATELVARPKRSWIKRAREALARRQRNAVIAAKRAAHELTQSLKPREFEYVNER